MQKALPQRSGKISQLDVRIPLYTPLSYIYIYTFTSKYISLMPNVIGLSIWCKISMNFHITNCTYDFVITLPASIYLTHDSEKGIARVLSTLELATVCQLCCELKKCGCMTCLARVCRQRSSLGVSHALRKLER